MCLTNLVHFLEPSVDLIYIHWMTEWFSHWCHLIWHYKMRIISYKLWPHWYLPNGYMVILKKKKSTWGFNLNIVANILLGIFIVWSFIHSFIPQTIIEHNAFLSRALLVLSTLQSQHSTFFFSNKLILPAENKLPVSQSLVVFTKNCLWNETWPFHDFH